MTVSIEENWTGATYFSDGKSEVLVQYMKAFEYLCLSSPLLTVIIPESETN